MLCGPDSQQIKLRALVSLSSNQTARSQFTILQICSQLRKMPGRKARLQQGLAGLFKM
jgi:hypothetical protein